MSKDGLDRRFGYILNLSFFLNLDIFLILPKKKQSFGGLPVPINLLIKSELKTQFLTTYLPALVVSGFFDSVNVSRRE